MKLLLPLALLFLAAAAHESERAPLDEGLLLPKIVDLTSNKQLTNWETRGSTQITGGRLMLTPEGQSRLEGSIWNKNYKLSKKAFSIEYTFRATGDRGKTGNGIAFWLLNDSQGNVDRLVRADTSLFGGPSKFDGLAFVVDSNGPLGSTLRGYANDNSKVFDAESPEFYHQDFGKCIIGYQDSQVPATLRVTYDEIHHQLRVSIDNKLCFENSKFVIPENELNLIVGVSASSGKHKKHEAFELFKLNVYELSLPGELEYDKVELAAQPVVVTKNQKGEVVSKKTGLELEKEKLVAQKLDLLGQLNEEQLNTILGKLSAFDEQLSQKLAQTMEKQKLDNTDLQRQIERLSLQNSVLEKYLKEVDRKLHSLVLTELDKKQEKENLRAEQIQKADLERLLTEKLHKSIKMFFWLLLVLVGVLGAFIFRLRSDIKHAKLL